ncbi:MAG TPA: hypothetical protein DCE42_27280, partial [Myxococcales bacterium]|nr:hypothetical protein [Myxococcales bacterium]
GKWQLARRRAPVSKGKWQLAQEVCQQVATCPTKSVSKGKWPLARQRAAVSKGKWKLAPKERQ